MWQFLKLPLKWPLNGLKCNILLLGRILNVTRIGHQAGASLDPLVRRLTVFSYRQVRHLKSVRRLHRPQDASSSARNSTWGRVHSVFSLKCYIWNVMVEVIWRYSWHDMVFLFLWSASVLPLLRCTPVIMVHAILFSLCCWLCHMICVPNGWQKMLIGALKHLNSPENPSHFKNMRLIFLRLMIHFLKSIKEYIEISKKLSSAPDLKPRKAAPCRGSRDCGNIKGVTPEMIWTVVLGYFLEVWFFKIGIGWGLSNHVCM